MTLIDIIMIIGSRVTGIIIKIIVEVEGNLMNGLVKELMDGLIINWVIPASINYHWKILIN